MDDLISRQSAIEAVHEEFDECLVWDESGETTANEIERILDGLPSAQSNRVKCAHCKKYDLHDHRCKHWNHGVSNVDWCSYAEAKDGSN